MKILKQILSYVLWIMLSFIFSFIYMRIVLGAKKNTGLSVYFNWVYDLALFQFGAILGGIIVFLFVLIDIGYLKNMLKNHSGKNVIRFLVLVGIALVVVVSHYLCEKVFDII